MFRSPIVKIVLGAIAVIIILGLLRFKPWQRSHSVEEIGGGREQLNVGFLPVT